MNKHHAFSPSAFCHMFTTILRKDQAVIFKESEQMSHMFPTTAFTVLQLVERQEEIRLTFNTRPAEVD